MITLVSCKKIVRVVTLTRPLTRRFSSEEVAGLTGLTYRQLDYNVARLFADPKLTHPGTGATSRRQFSFDELLTMAAFAELIKAGVTARTAAQIATGSPEFEQGNIQIQLDVPAVQADLQERIDAQSNQ